MQRRPSRRPILFTQFALALKATLVSHRFHDIPSLVLAHVGQTHVQLFVRLSAFRDCFAKLSKCTRCLIQPLSAPSWRKPNQLRNTNSKCRHSRLSPEKSEGLPNSLGSTLVDRRPTFAARGLLISPMSLIAHSVSRAHKPVKQSGTFSLDQDSKPAGCARNVPVSLMNNLLDNSN